MIDSTPPQFTFRSAYRPCPSCTPYAEKFAEPGQFVAAFPVIQTLILRLRCRRLLIPLRLASCKRSSLEPMNEAARFSLFLFLPDVLGTASADNRCARHSCPFCFAPSFLCFEEAHRERFRSHHKVQGLHFSRIQRKTLRSPEKARPQVWEQPASRFSAQAQQGQME
jgi:hypothetical protein